MSLFNLPERLTLEEADGLKEILIRLTETEDQQIGLNGSQVEQVDTAGLQLLLALNKTSGSLKKEVIIIAPSPAFLQVLVLSGADQILRVEEVV